MTEQVKYEIITSGFSRVSVNGRVEWKTKRIAEKHAREFTEKHGKIARVYEV
tara:strand:+ start:1232 stop:1387 length:156 start_codon:yes stop_codon:yes gene_type:complete